MGYVLPSFFPSNPKSCIRIYTAAMEKEAVGEWPMARLEHAEKKRRGAAQEDGPMADEAPRRHDIRRGIGGDARGRWGPWSESVQRSVVGMYGSRTALRGRGRSLH